MKPEDKYIKILTSDYRCLDLPLNNRFVELDIGCGKGGFSRTLAERYPEHLILSADLMLGRLRKLQKKIQIQSLSNIHILRVEAWHLIGYVLPDTSITRTHMLCPDPWPKLRHRAHRLLSSEFLGRLSRVLIPGAVFHFATDDNNYFDSALEIISGSGIFSRDDTKIADIMDIKTDFEKRWEKHGRAVKHAGWIKTS